MPCHLVLGLERAEGTFVFLNGLGHMRSMTCTNLCFLQQQQWGTSAQFRKSFGIIWVFLPTQEHPKHAIVVTTAAPDQPAVVK